MLDPYASQTAPLSQAPKTVDEVWYTSERIDRISHRIAAAGELIDLIDADLPSVFFDAGYEVSSGSKDATGLDNLAGDCDRESFLTAYAVKGLAGDIDITARNFQRRNDGTVYPIDFELAGYTSVEELEEQILGEHSVFGTNIYEVAEANDVQTDNIAEDYRERVTELADSVDEERLDQRLDENPYTDRGGTCPDHREMRADERIYQNVIDAQSN